MTAPARKKSSAATSSACVYPSYPRCACAACLTWFAAAVCADACALPERSARHARPQSLAPPPFLPQKTLQDHRDCRRRGPPPAHALFPACALLLGATLTTGACALGQDIIFALAASGVCVAFRRGAQGPFESPVRASLPCPIQAPLARSEKEKASKRAGLRHFDGWHQPVDTFLSAPFFVRPCLLPASPLLTFLCRCLLRRRTREKQPAALFPQHFAVRSHPQVLLPCHKFLCTSCAQGWASSPGSHSSLSAATEIDR